MKITLTWPGGEHDFALPIGRLRAVQDACDAGPMEILGALRTGRWRVDMPLSVLRHGLIGAGMDEGAARSLMQRLTDAHPLAEFIVPASLVIAAAVMGVADDPVGEQTGAMSPLESGSSVPSTKAAPKRASRRAKSTQ
ncbi:hypothetical protein CG51_05815 [Haematobacter missouriensis]|uniref:Gene transfer agent family protein n=1 Tax=Haematobacter missouriensis TaxID=366616 RepID=A0A212AQU2_9RHOB|nr:gene transfer agent family protein [Haematobacter missouriensis]KFI30960.1 hypothetical protein CG51_05815 [Haematobacter missouriensis]OWJ73881.1 hypothetical protein CDV53_14215 [Haematobacter missouriensis]OWJ83823.1 hypothetical protein CDV52_09950 [Haematobacter missouriensis]